MVFVGGPRQVGKTPLGKMILPDPKAYLNFDVAEHRNAILRSELPASGAWFFDEIHKYRGWRNFLKGLYDASGKASESWLREARGLTSTASAATPCRADTSTTACIRCRSPRSQACRASLRASDATAIPTAIATPGRVGRSRVSVLDRAEKKSFHQGFVANYFLLGCRALVGLLI
jgi:AAA domain